MESGGTDLGFGVHMGTTVAWRSPNRIDAVFSDDAVPTVAPAHARLASGIMVAHATRSRQGRHQRHVVTPLEPRSLRITSPLPAAADVTPALAWTCYSDRRPNKRRATKGRSEYEAHALLTSALVADAQQEPPARLCEIGRRSGPSLRSISGSGAYASRLTRRTAAPAIAANAYAAKTPSPTHGASVCSCGTMFMIA